MKKMVENPREMAMKAGVVAVGADNQRDASLGRTERSERGEQRQYHFAWDRNNGGRTIVRVQDRKRAVNGCTII